MFAGGLLCLILSRFPFVSPVLFLNLSPISPTFFFSRPCLFSNGQKQKKSYCYSTTYTRTHACSCLRSRWSWWFGGLRPQSCSWFSIRCCSSWIKLRSSPIPSSPTSGANPKNPHLDHKMMVAYGSKYMEAILVENCFDKEGLEEE